LIEAVRAIHPGARFTGVAGPRMRRAGCNPIYDMVKHSSMLVAAFGQVHHAYQMLAASRKSLREQTFDAAVVIDAPTLNLPVARRARKRGIPVLYYIAPQTWAWGERVRIPRVRAGVDRIACIWPFEEAYFRSHGISAEYVGHPLFAQLQARRVDRELVARLRAGGRPVLVIMPGSRRQEIEENFHHQLQVASEIANNHKDLKVLVSVAHPRVKRLLQARLRAKGLKAELHERINPELLEAADLALVVSGTIALEGAYHRTPMIIMYNSSRWLYLMLRWMISTRYFSMPNILAGNHLVPEFMPYYRSVEPIVERALQMLADPSARRALSEALGRLVSPFLDSTASDNAARILLSMAGAPAGPSSAFTPRERGSLSSRAQTTASREPSTVR
jgi:lipid-A-disaccharide synthase